MEGRVGQHIPIVDEKEIGEVRDVDGEKPPYMLDEKDEACLRQAEEEADQRKGEYRKRQWARWGRLFVLICVTAIAGGATTVILWEMFPPYLAIPLGLCIAATMAWGTSMVDAGLDPMWQGGLELTLKRAADDRKRGWILIIGGMAGVIILATVRVFVYLKVGNHSPIALVLGSVTVLLVDLAPIAAAMWYAQVERIVRDLWERYVHAEQFVAQLKKNPEQAAERLWPDAVLATYEELQPLVAQLNRGKVNVERKVREASALEVHVLSKRVAFLKEWLSFLRQSHPFFSFTMLDPVRLKQFQIEQIEAQAKKASNSAAPTSNGRRVRVSATKAYDEFDG
jgi:hypothetical protein